MSAITGHGSRILPTPRSAAAEHRGGKALLPRLALKSSHLVKEEHCFLLFNSPFTSCPPHLRALESITLSHMWGKLRHGSIKKPAQCPADVKPKPVLLDPKSSELGSCG